MCVWGGGGSNTPSTAFQAVAGASCYLPHAHPHLPEARVHLLQLLLLGTQLPHCALGVAIGSQRELLLLLHVGDPAPRDATRHKVYACHAERKQWCAGCKRLANVQFCPDCALG